MREESETFTDYLVEEGHVVDSVMPVGDVVLQGEECYPVRGGEGGD